MLRKRIEAGHKLLAAMLAVMVFLVGQFAVAQDNSQGRYRPDGRQIAAQISRGFGERLYEVRTYDPQPQVDEFSAAAVFYPLTLSFAPPIGVVALVPGFRGAGENYEWWGPMLASFGYAVIIIDTNQPTDTLDARKQALIAAVEFMRSENNNADSPVAGKLDMNKVALMGHSMGGGAALHAADELGDALKAVVPLSPYCCEPGQSFTGDFSSLGVPTLIFASAEDDIAPPAQHARLLYDSIADSTTKAYVEFATGDHMIATNSGPDLTTLGRYTMAWLKYNLDGQSQYEDALFGEQEEEYASKFSSYDTSR